MATPQLQRLEVWSDFQGAGGSRLAFLPVDNVTSLTTTERVTRDDEGSCVLTKEAAAYASLAGGTVLRFLKTDATFEEWRVLGLRDSSRQARYVTLRLRSPLMELERDGVLSETTGIVTSVDIEWKGLTPTEIATRIMTGAGAMWTLGTVTPTIPCNLAPSGWNRLRALRELVTAIRSQGVSAELDYRRNGTSGYFVDIVSAIGASASTLDVRTGRNLLSTDRARDNDKYATEVIPLGSGSPRPSIRGAWWECTAKSTNVLTLQQPVTGGLMLAFDDQLNGLYIVDGANTPQLITDSVAGATQTITVADGSFFSVGGWYRVVLDSSGTDLIRLRKNAATAGPARIVETTQTGSTNHIRNPAMRVWTGPDTSPPDDWSSIGTPTLTRTTTAGLWVYGGRSLRIQTNASAQAFDIRSPISTIGLPDGSTTAVFSLWFRPVSNTSSPAFSIYVDGVGPFNTVDLSSSTTYPPNAWHRVDASLSLAGYAGPGLLPPSTNIHTFQVRFVSTVNSLVADYYVDAAQLTIDQASAVSFMEGSDGARLWGFGNAHLTTFGTTATSLTVTFADLGLWSPTDFPFAVVALGQTASVRDTDLDVTTSARVLEVRRDWKNPLASQLTIASRAEDLVSILSGLADAAA